MGTYKPSTGVTNSDVSDCLACPADKYCGTLGLITPGVCDSGYYLTGSTCTLCQVCSSLLKSYTP